VVKSDAKVDLIERALVGYARAAEGSVKAFRKPKATRVEPEFFADVEYRDITSEGLLGQSSFKGLSRGDKSWLPHLFRHRLGLRKPS
jgi:hypothetical protein